MEFLRGAVVLLFLGAAGIGALIYYCVHMPGDSHRGSLPELTAAQGELRDRLRSHVRVLAGEIGERHQYQRSNLDAAADYITAQFEAMGLVPSPQMVGDGFRNIVVDLYGRESRDEVLVVGAHYDSVTMTPGADDNASGVAGLLELARLLRERPLRRSVRLIAFTNEEWPFFGRDDMGSRVSARLSHERDENVTGMFSLEMIGYYSDEPRSQWYPRIVRRFYPEQANFIAFVSNFASRDLLVRGIGAFRRHARFPSEGMSAPEWLVRDVRRSDQSSYWSYGFPGVMITDTANFRNYGYHNVGDMPGTLDYDSMARVVHGLAAMLAELAGGNLIE
ncbi:MAG: M28 family peptidase [Gammaproteobacteria bacterium]|nr:M28 family peptidase [Gammaproteobacteria bacterium]